MSDVKDAVMDDTRLTEASEWFVRLREAAVTNDVIGAWLTWCNDHPDNARAYREIQEIWSLAGDAGVSEWPSPAQVRSDPYWAESSIAAWKVQQLRGGAGSAAPAMQRPTRRYFFAFAASLLLVIGLGGALYYWNAQPRAAVYATERAAKREVRLADGSRVSLGGASAIRVAYEDDRRNIELESGEAHFDVTPDKTRPFIVRARDVQVTAVGTAFTVRTDDVRTVVSVTHGLVEIAGSDPRFRFDSPLRAKAGEQVTYDAARRAAVKQPSDDTIALGWQEGALSYVDEPLRAVIARVNRNSTHEIVLTDAVLGELRFTGTVRENEVAEWAHSLERVFPVRIVAETDGRIKLEPR